MILANRRKHKVKGRTTTLTTSTRHKKEMRYQGALEGKTKDKVNDFMNWMLTLLSQATKDNLKLKASVVVTGYL